MKINAVSNTLPHRRRSHYSPKFASLNVTPEAQAYLNRYGAEGLKKLEGWKKELANTNVYDLVVDDCVLGFLTIDINFKEHLCNEQNKKQYWLHFYKNKENDAACVMEWSKKQGKEGSLDALDYIGWAVDEVKSREGRPDSLYLYLSSTL